MKTFINILIFLTVICFIGCFNIYNEADEDMNAEYKYYLTVINHTWDGTIATFSLNSDNKPVISSKKATNNQNYPTFGAVHPNGKYLYIPNHGSGWERASEGDGTTLSMYFINDDGGLSPLGTPTNTVATGTGPWTVKIHPSGKIVYVTNDASDNVSIYQVKNDGTLESLGSPKNTGGRPKGLAIDPMGKYLYVTNYDGLSISMYRIDNGLLTELSSSPLSTGGGNSPWDIAIHPNGKYAYATINNGGGNGQIFVYSINNEGTLVALTPFIIPDNGNPYNIVIHPSGKYLYFANYGSVVACTISSTNGTLSFLNRKNDVSNDIGASTTGIAIDPYGRYIYTSAGGSTVVAFFELLSSGELDLTNFVGYHNFSGVTDGNPVGLIINRKKIK